MIEPKSAAEIQIMREGGKRHASILQQLADLCVPGASSFAIEDKCRALCKEMQVVPAFLNYQPAGAHSKFPAALCFSVNDEIVHGIPNQREKILQPGDVVTIDLGITYQGLITDAALTVAVGPVSPEIKQLLHTAYQALDSGISAAKLAAPVSAIGAAIETTIKNSGDYAIYRDLVGHGVGYDVHEYPNVPNFDTGESSPTLIEGTVIAIEPMIGLGKPKFRLGADNWTYKTSDGSIAVHVEHTIAITQSGPLVLTALSDC